MKLMFKSLQISTWRQIQEVQIDFHPRLTILTGANGSGKTTILNLLSRHFGWSIPLVGTPIRSKTGILKYVTDFWKAPKWLEATKSRHIIGQITYEGDEGDKIASLSIPASDQTFQIEIAPPNPVSGLHIPSHRPVYTYQGVSSIPTQPITRQQAFSNYADQVRSRYMGLGGGRTANVVIKEALLGLATFGYGNEVVMSNPQARILFEQFQEILRSVLPPKLGFEKIRIEMPEVMLVTKSGNFSLDAVSGGVAAIIDMAWQIFMYSDGSSSFVVTIDEPENHLHPELQQTILTGFLAAFPHIQFIVATHNPFIISSVADSNVYVLDYNADNKVTSNHLDFVNKAGTANEILRDVLGLPFTMPVWAERQLEALIRKYSSIKLSEESLMDLRRELEMVGLEKLVPDSIAKVIDSQK